MSLAPRAPPFWKTSDSGQSSGPGEDLLSIRYMLSQNPEELCNPYPNIMLSPNRRYRLLPFDFCPLSFDLPLRITGVARPSPASLSIALSRDR
jgi:hypothetical protein